MAVTYEHLQLVKLAERAERIDKLERFVTQTLTDIFDGKVEYNFTVYFVGRFERFEMNEVAERFRQAGWVYADIWQWWWSKDVRVRLSLYEPDPDDGY